MDIVERARTIALGTDSPWPLIIEMADEIERLREALQTIADNEVAEYPDVEMIRDFASAKLKEFK